jgi:hypothetical protein
MRKQQAEGGGASGESKRDRTKSAQTVAYKLKEVVEQMIHKKGYFCPNMLTVFVPRTQQEELLISLLEDVRKEHLELFRDKRQLMEAVSLCYDQLTLAVEPI